jgi:hypothetical protein
MRFLMLPLASLLFSSPALAGFVTPAVTYATGTRPLFVAAADFNGDGHQDLAVTNRDSNTVSILLGAGDGTFGAKTDFAMGIYPVGVVAADFNSDGHQDLAVANSISNTVSILLGAGDGTFGAMTDFAVGSGPVGIVAADFNGDGHQDLAAANYGSSTVSILTGNGDGSFNAKVDWAMPNGPEGVAVADFNGDGHADLLAGGDNDSVVHLRLGNGDGSFQNAVSLSAGDGSSSVSSADLNGDGHRDVVVSNHWENTLSILLGNGDGTFQPQVTYAMGAPMESVIADFNGDGVLDIAVANIYAPSISLLRGNGDGTFQAKADYVPAGAFGLAAADFNGDGKADLAVAGFWDANVVSILLQEGAPVLTSVGVSGTTQTGTTLSATSDEAATGYWIVVARAATAPSAAQVKAAATYSGVTIVADGNAAMTANVAKNFSVAGLSAGTNYDLYIVAEDGDTNVASPTKVQFATGAAADTTPDAYTFTAQSGAARSTVTTSNAITVAGIDSAAAISITGGEYSVSTDGGTNWSDWSTATPANVSVNHQVKVRLTSSANYSTAATATLTIGGVNGTFTVTTEAAPSPGGGYEPPPPPTTLTVSANGSGTLTGSITQVTVNGGATLTIPATIAAAGVTLNLPTPATGSASPVTLTLNGQSLNVTPGAAGTVLRVTSATVTLNGVPTVVQLVSLSAGSITVSGSGQTLLSIGSGTPPRLIASGGNEAVTALATLDAASGDTLLAVSGGMVVLPAVNTATRSAAATQTEIHAGETVTFDSAGQIKSHRAGSPSGSNGAGDPLTIANRPATLTLDATLSNLKGGLARLDGQSPEQAALALLGADFTLGNGGQTAAGVLPLTVGQTTLHLLPLGPLDIDASQPDGVSLTADGLYQFVRNGVVMRFAPSVRDSRQLADDLAAAFSGATARLHGDGVIVVRVDGVDFVMQPDLSAESGSGNVMEFDFDGEGHLRYRDAQGYRQVLHPAFADLATLRTTLTAAIPGIAVNRNNGVTTAAIGAITYTLVPDYTLTSVPVEQAGRSWWNGADGKLYIRNADGTAQGFAVR